MKSYLLDTTEKLIAYDTVSAHGDGAAADFLADELQRMGFSVHFQETAAADEARQTNLVAWAGPAEPDGLILSGHIDTVPFQDQPGWTVDPLALAEKGDRLLGRGVTDMKGFLAQCLAALRDLEVERLERPVVLLFTCLEEVGCLGARALSAALPEILPDIPIPKLAWIGEPTNYEIFHAHKGVVDFEIEIRGQGGHSSLPDLGVNAIAVAGQVLQEIADLQREYRSRRDEAAAELFPEAPYNTFNVGVIRGGAASNMIAEQCRLRMSYRPLPDEDPLAAYHALCERLAALPGRDAAGGPGVAEIEVGAALAVDGLDSPRGTELERALCDEPSAKRAGAPFCTDGGAFANAGIESLICGPGELAQAHQPDESVPRRALERGPGLIQKVLREMCGAQFKG